MSLGTLKVRVGRPEAGGQWGLSAPPHIYDWDSQGQLRLALRRGVGEALASGAFLL